MSHPSPRRAVRRIQAVLAKGPDHMLALGRWYTSWAVQRWRGAWSPRATGEGAFLAQLNLPRAGRASSAGAGPATRGMAVEHFRNRAQPVFCFDPSNVQALAGHVDDTAREVAIASADAVCRHVFGFRGEPPVVFNGPVDWFYRPRGNVDWTWELNRHAFFVILGRAYAYTGDERYVHEFRSLLLDWLAHNPPGVNQPNWSSVLEVAYRINVWLWAYHLFLAAPAFDDEVLLACLRGLWVHGRYLAANLEHHVQNNHLLLESKALAMCGLMFPEFRDARAWLDRGLGILWREIRQQVRPDGVHAEQSTMYHRVLTSELLEILVLLDDNRVVVPPDVRDRFARMLDFEQAVTKPDGQIPLIGDSSLGDSYARFSALGGGAALLGRAHLAPGSLDEATLWLVGPERARSLNAGLDEPAPATSQAFRDGGYFVMRHGKGPEAAYLVFDCGPFGYRPVPGHGHADALSFELYAGGRTLIADPGAYSYHLGEDWRNYFRGTSAHNTVVVDGLDQSLLLGLWHVARPAQTTLREWVTAQHFDFVDGCHDGYTHLRHPVTHRRQVFFAKPDYWIILDLFEGQGPHRLDLYFHLMPDANVSLDPGSGAARVRHGEGTDLLIYPIWNADARVEVTTGGLDPIQGWVSRYSAEKKAAATLRYTRFAPVPARWGTVLYPCPQADEATVHVSPLTVLDEGEMILGADAVTGLKIDIGPWTDYFVVDYRERPDRKAFDGYIADGRLVYLRRHSAEGAVVKAVLHRGSTLLQGDGHPVASANDPTMAEVVCAQVPRGAQGDP